MMTLNPAVVAQSVCLPLPRLLTTTPMGGQVGTTVDVVISGDHLDDVEALVFSDPRITAVAKFDDKGQQRDRQFVVTIADSCPAGVHDARILSRLGISSPRCFSVGLLPEVTRTVANTELGKAMPLELNTICNASLTKQAVDYFSFAASEGQRVVVACAGRGIDSRVNPVLIVANAAGEDLVVERRGGRIDFQAPADGTYICKVHDLTFNGGAHYFYRLSLQAVETDENVPEFAVTKPVNSFSWPPPGLAVASDVDEAEPNNLASQAHKIELPCDINGRFFPAADVDLFEFHGSKGDVWWVEVASERLGLPTDPSIVVQQVTGTGEDEVLTDVAELTDVPSPVKVSSNGYSYDGPPYNAGTSDIIGRFEVKQDGVHRVRITDLFGGTRNDPKNVYRMIIRKAAPDFSIVGWALHMNLRNGDRNALSKPLSLRGGSTVPIEVVTIRRDGFDGPIDLNMEGLPEGVTATGLRIPAGQSRGIVLLTADQNAPRGLTYASFRGTAEIDGKQVTRTGRLASMQWPVTNARNDIPAPRLVARLPVAVCGSEFAPISFAPTDEKVWEVTAGQQLKIPMISVKRCGLSGQKISFKTFGGGFEKNTAFDAPLDEETFEAVLDLPKLKTKPGEYTVAFYGSVVAKYAYHPEAVTIAEAALVEAKSAAASAAEQAQTLATSAIAATDADKATVAAASREATKQKQAADAAVTAAERVLKAAVKAAAPKDIVDIVVSKPITIRVLSADEGDSQK